MPAKSLQSSPTLCLPTRLLCPWGSSRQENWSGLPRPPQGDLPYSGIEPQSPVSPTLPVGSLPLAPAGKPIYMTVARYN